MLARLVVRALFPSEWALKERCQHRGRGFAQRLCLDLHAYLQYENNSSIAWNSKFAGEPCFTHVMKGLVLAGKQVVLSRDAVDNRFYSFRGRWVYFADGGWSPFEDTAVLARLERHA